MDDAKRRLQAYWAEVTSELPAPTVETASQERVGESMERPIQQRRSTGRRPAWAKADSR